MMCMHESSDGDGCLHPCAHVRSVDQFVGFEVQVQVIETSLGITNKIKLLRHLGLRVGDDDDFVEAHFGAHASRCSCPGPAEATAD